MTATDDDDAGVTRAEAIYDENAVGGLIGIERLRELCSQHVEMAPMLLQVDFLRRHLREVLEPRPVMVPGYRLERRLGRGGMGEVFAALHLRLDRLVALKVIDPAMAEDEGARQRFLREARAMAQVTHRHVVPIFEVIAEGETHALAMELVVGADLSTVVEALGRAPCERHAEIVAGLLGGCATAPWPGVVPFVVAVANQVAQALSAVHAAGLLHRDVKPSNIRVRAADRTAVLLDFGVARRLDVATRTVGFIGTPAFAPPEQLAKHTTDERADLYALARTLYVCLRTGLGLEAAAGDEFEPLHRHTMAVTRDLDAVLAMALEPDPRDRYQSASAMARDLAAVVEGGAVGARPRSRARRFLHWWVRDRVRLSLLTVAGVAVLLATVLWWQWPRVLAARASERAEKLEATLQLGHHLLLDPSRRTTAIAVFQSARELAPDDEDGLLGAIGCHIMQGDVVAAKALANEHPAWHRLGGDLDLLLTDEGTTNVTGPLGDADLRIVAMVRYLRALRTGRPGDFATAVEALRQLRWFEPRARQLHYGMTLYAAAKASTASEFAGLRPVADRAAAALDTLWPDSATAQAWIAQGLFELDPSRALTAAENALQLDPGLTHLRQITIGARVALGERDRAAAELEAALAADPTSIGLLLLRCDLELGRGQPEVALQTCLLALEREPDSVPAMSRIAELLWQSDRTAALPYLQRLTQLAPHLPHPHQNLARLRFAAKDYAAASAFLERALALDPRDGISACLLGECRFHLKSGDALEPLQAATRLLPANARPHYFLSREWHRRGDLDAAIAAAEAAAGLVDAGDTSVGRDAVHRALAQLRRLRGQ